MKMIYLCVRVTLRYMWLGILNDLLVFMEGILYDR